MTLRLLRDRIRTIPVLAQLWKAGVLVAGMLCIVTGLVLVVLPGPLTIPPVLVGLWLWSTEFPWARRRFVALKLKAEPGLARIRKHRTRTLVWSIAGAVPIVALGWVVQMN